MWVAVEEQMNNSLVELTRQANIRRRMFLDYQIGDLVKIHHSGISRNFQ